MPHILKAAFTASLLALAPALPAQEAQAPLSAFERLQPAHVFGYPLDAMARARARVPAQNILSYQDKPNDPRPLGLARQDADHLHATAWLDLTTGPVILELPALAGRYHAVAISSMATDLLALLGTRTGSQGGRYALVSVDDTGPYPEGTIPLRLACHSCRLVARVLVRNAADLEAAREALAGITLQATATPAPATAADWHGRVNMVIAGEGPASLIAQKAAQFPALAQAEDWQQNLSMLEAAFRDTLASARPRVNGWGYPPFTITDSSADDLTRAQMAELAPDALPRVEMMEMETGEDETGQPLDGRNAYRLRIPYQLPVGGYWSVTMYRIDAKGELVFVPNELDRHAVGDRSEHLRADRNGSTELFIQADRPQGERVVNWLPAPRGRFRLVFRAGLPKAEFLDGSFRLPPVTQDEPIP